MTKKILLVVPTEDDSGLKGVVSNIFAKAPTFTFIDIVDGEIGDVRVKENEVADLPQGSGPLVIKNFKDKGVDLIIASDIGLGAKTLIEISGIKMVKVKPNIKVKEAVIEGLKQILQPSIQS